MRAKSGVPGRLGLLAQRLVEMDHGEDGEPVQKMVPVSENIWRLLSATFKTAVSFTSIHYHHNHNSYVQQTGVTGHLGTPVQTQRQEQHAR